MERVMGIGGIFFKASNKACLAAWYRDNLGVAVDEAWGGAIFHWKENNPEGNHPGSYEPGLCHPALMAHFEEIKAAGLPLARPITRSWSEWILTARPLWLAHRFRGNLFISLKHDKLLDHYASASLD